MYQYWRMVLVEGPAFGGSTEGNIFQVQFNLIDPSDQAPPNEGQFTDDVTDALSGTPTITAADPTKQPLSDGDTDVLTGTPEVIINFDLTEQLTDGNSDVLTGRSSLAPSIFVQSFAIVKGR
jgi:hypothetical protein